MQARIQIRPFFLSVALACEIQEGEAMLWLCDYCVAEKGPEKC